MKQREDRHYLYLYQDKAGEEPLSRPSHVPFHLNTVKAKQEK